MAEREGGSRSCGLYHSSSVHTHRLTHTQTREQSHKHSYSTCKQTHLSLSGSLCNTLSLSHTHTHSFIRTAQRGHSFLGASRSERLPLNYISPSSVVRNCTASSQLDCRLLSWSTESKESNLCHESVGSVNKARILRWPEEGRGEEGQRRGEGRSHMGRSLY